jgi:hypothetical protein
VEYKRRILAEADACTEHGALGKLLRREGLYNSHVLDWRAARDRGELDVAAAPVKRGPPPKVLDDFFVSCLKFVDRFRIASSRGQRRETGSAFPWRARGM